MPRGPVPDGESTTDEDAMTAGHAAWDDEPPWLDDDLPPDRDAGDERDWPGDTPDWRGDAVTAQAERDGAEYAAVTARLIAAEIETAAAHVPGTPVIPGIKAGPAGGFGQGEPLDQAAPSPALDWAADYASGDDRAFGGVSDDELFGVLGVRQRLESRQGWEKLMGLAELIRRRPAPGCKLTGPGRMPRVWAEGTAAEASVQFAITQRAADGLLSLAWDLVVKLPVTSANLRDGIIDANKAQIVATYCANLTPEEAREAERILFATPDIEQKTRTTFRDRIARAVIQVNPEAARRRREDAAKECRIEVCAEESGNAMIAGRELPSVAVLRLDQKLTARARELKRLGVDGHLDDLRVLAFLERFGEADPEGDLARANQTTRTAGAGDDCSSADASRDSGGRACGGTGAGSGLAGVVHLTAPVLTLTELARRPGVLRGMGPIDPYQVRDLADAASASPMTTYQFTITGQDGRPIAHARGRPGPGDLSRSRRRTHSPPGNPANPGNPATGPSRLTLTHPGPPGGHGTWLYQHGGRQIIFEFENLDGDCDHRHQAPGHDPGTHLRHLTGVLHTECTFPTCRTPQHRADYEHSTPHDQGGITCLCTCGPVCRRNHQHKQGPSWRIETMGRPGWFRWKLPSGRTYLSAPDPYPVL
ncbi:MAG: DUF222 domain-containing protein [Streptosporangiaceae bacterium]|nr:DUF222 domain-containing protein [Streptosporangiaceae bacterium]